MRLVADTVWNSRRKWLGNLIPALFWVPPAVIGLILLIKSGQLIGSGLWCLVSATVIGWFAVNQFGFFENQRMRKQLERIIQVQDKKLPQKHFFVGFASPKYSSMLDAHEDVGFLCLESNQISFISETRSIEIAKTDVKEIRFRFNVHSLILLGRWISIEAHLGDKKIRLLIEPRERRTLLGNRFFGNGLLRELRKWRGPVK